MIEIRPLVTYDREQSLRIGSQYTSAERYRVRRDETSDRISFVLELEALEQPYVRTWIWSDDEIEGLRRAVEEHGCSFGAYDGSELVGVLIAELRAWHEDLCVMDLQVRADRHRQGIGRRLVDAAADRARSRGLRMVTCETQNTNVPAIRFYRSVGFELAGIDLWFYPPVIGEVALFMKRVVRGG